MSGIRARQSHVTERRCLSGYILDILLLHYHLTLSHDLLFFVTSSRAPAPQYLHSVEELYDRSYWRSTLRQLLSEPGIHD